MSPTWRIWNSRRRKACACARSQLHPGHIDKLNELDTRNVEPMAQVVSAIATAGEDSDPFAYAQRADEVTPGLSRKVALSNAPDTDGTCFKVPKVIER